MSKRENIRKDNFLASIPIASFSSKTDLIAKKCKFNFSYLDVSQNAGQCFSDWTYVQLCRLLDKLHNFSKDSLKYWATQRIGGGGNRLFVIYDKFPSKSEFVHPKHVPHEARWARFRLEGDMRLIGFVVQEDMHDTICENTKVRFDTNTFYIVFLDENHKFYLTK